MLIPFNILFNKYRIKTDGVLHLGANTGQEAEEYAAQGIENVVWVEAHPEIYKGLVKHTVRYPKHKTIMACVGEEDGKRVVFHVANNGSQSSSVLDFGTHSKEHPTVKFVEEIEMTMFRVDTLMEQFKIEIGQDWFLNIDLQGAELMALRGMGELLHRFRYVYIEVNIQELYKGCPHVRDIDNYLAGFGFEGKETAMTKAGWGDKFFMKG